MGCEYRESMKPFDGKRDAEAEAYDTMVHGTSVEGSDDMYSFDSCELQQINEFTLEPMEKRLVNHHQYFSISIKYKRDGSKDANYVNI